MINKEGLSKLLRDLRVLDFLKDNLNISIDNENLCIEPYETDNWNNQSIELKIPDYIYNDIFDWVVENEI